MKGMRILRECEAAISEISRVCGSVGLSAAAHNSLCTGHILAFGNEEQKQKYLPDLCTGHGLWGFGLTEAEAGSDAQSSKTTAKFDGVSRFDDQNSSLLVKINGT